MKNILVAIDFEENIEPIIDKAFELANSFNAKVWLLHIAAPEPYFVGYEVGPQYIRDWRAEDLRTEHRQLQRFTSELEGKGIDVEGLLIQGATIEMIIGESKKLNVDLIIAGHHEHSFFYNALVGSVSSQIIKKSKIPALIVPVD